MHERDRSSNIRFGGNVTHHHSISPARESPIRNKAHGIAKAFPYKGGSGRKHFPHARAAPWALWGVMAAWGASHTAGGDAAAVAVTYQQRHRTYSLRFALAEGPPCSASDCWPDAMDLAFLLGYGTRVGGIFQASAGAGLGVANLRDDGGVALAGELQLSLRPTRFLGAAVYGWGNTVGPQFGAAFGVQIGRFR